MGPQFGDGMDETWSVPERATSLYPGENWWLAAESGLWRSADLGQTWKLAHKAASLQRVYFATVHQTTNVCWRLNRGEWRAFRGHSARWLQQP